MRISRTEKAEPVTAAESVFPVLLFAFPAGVLPEVKKEYRSPGKCGTI